MKSLFKNLFNSPMRSPTAEESYAFKLHMTPGTIPYEEVTNTKASCSISGARYGIVNSIVSSFSTDIPPVEDDGLRGCPAFTQLAKMTEALTDASWAKNLIASITTTSTYQNSALWQIIESTENGYHSVIQSSGWAGASDNSVIGFSFVYKSNGRGLQIVLRSKEGAYPTVCMISTDGIISSKNASAFVISESLGDGLYRITAAIPCGAGTYNPYLYWQMRKESTSSYTGDGVSGVAISQLTHINFGVSGIPFSPPYIPNNTTASVSVVSEVGTSTTGTSFDIDVATLSSLKAGLRGPNAQGHIELEFKSNIDSGWLVNNTVLNIFSVDNNAISGGLCYRKNLFGVLSFSASDNTSLIDISDISISLKAIYKISIDYGTYTDGTQKMRLTVNGVKSSVTAFSGSFGTQDLRFFYDNTINAGWIKSMTYSVRPLW